MVIFQGSHLRSIEHYLSWPILHPLRPIDLKVVVHSEHHLLPYASAHHVAHLQQGDTSKVRAHEHFRIFPWQRNGALHAKPRDFCAAWRCNVHYHSQWMPVEPRLR